MTKLSEKIKSRMDGDYPVIVQRTTLQDWLKDAEHLEGGGWIPCDRELPSPGSTVLVTGPDELQPETAPWYAVLTRRDFGWAHAYGHDEWGGYQPTHWQPLPPNP